MARRQFHVGDWVIYRKGKASPCPGPRAADISPASHGDDYTYTVDKLWTILEVSEDGTLVALTRKGKRHHIRPDDPNLHHAPLWMRLWYRSRFPRLPENQ